MFLINKNRHDSTLILIFCGVFQPDERRDQLIQLSNEVKEDFKKIQHTEHDQMLNKVLAPENFKGVDHVIITKHRRLKVKFNGHSEKVSGKIKKMIPEGIRVEVKILELQEHLGEIFLKKGGSKKQTSDVAQA